MKKIVDFYFFYKYTIRYILINKLIISKNTYLLPTINKFILFFNLVKIEDLNDIQLYNYIYLFKFFFGRNAFLTRIKSFFNLGKWSYSLKICLILKKKDLYPKIFFLFNDIFSNLEFYFFKTGIFSKSLKIYYIYLTDLNIFSEKKTNLGLFFLKKNLNLHLFCNGLDLYSTQHLLKNLKIYLF